MPNKYIYNFYIYKTVVGDYINTMKTTFDFNFVLYQAFKQHEYTNRMQRETVNCKLVIRKKLDNNKNLDKKSSSLY